VDLKRAAIGQDLLIGHPLVYAAPIVADKLDMPWVSIMLQPITFFSAYDPPILPAAPFLPAFRMAGPGFHRWFYTRVKEHTISWMAPVQRLRVEIGLDETPLHPLFDGQYSPLLNLAIYSSVMGERQPDWPCNSEITGFVFYDKIQGGSDLSPEIADFLDAGPPPIVFTLGSAAVNNPGEFYTEGIKTAKKLGSRAILLTGKEQSKQIDNKLPEGVRVFDYAPYSQLFPRASAIVHQGGIGTTAQALRAGKPQLIMPFAHDQPDNAVRIKKLGVGGTISRKQFTSTRASAMLNKMLSSERYAKKAAEVGKLIRSENGEVQACDAIEAVMA
jgi:UDP:flavonoid glycosyltransferase YjiC (YdhE family)